MVIFEHTLGHIMATWCVLRLLLVRFGSTWSVLGTVRGKYASLKFLSSVLKNVFWSLLFLLKIMFYIISRCLWDICIIAVIFIFEQLISTGHP
jgi:hypothetical protein